MEQTKNIDEPHSVKFIINTKGKYSAEIKCYGTTPEKALENTSRIAKTVEKLIELKNSKVS